MAQHKLKHFWHPCSQMKDHANFPPFHVKRAQGVFVELETGERVIDAISSWWCKTLGHNHPRLKAALLAQADQFEHVMLGNFTHDPILLLSEKLASLTPSLDKVFYASDGSCAVEIALKMSLHSRLLQNQSQKKYFMSLKNSYHGETLMALAVSDVGIYRKPYESVLPATHFIQSIPYVSGPEDRLWHDCSLQWAAAEKELAPFAESLTAIIIEPIVQGAGGMLIYSQDFLKRLRQWCNTHDVHLIADEIMTGFGRTGKMLACDHANIEPDFLCLGKGLTSGWLPMSAVLTSTAIYNLFYDDYETGKAFLHSHTHTGNALAAAIALETFEVLKDEAILLKTKKLEHAMRQLWNDIADKTGAIHNIRALGGISAVDLFPMENISRAGYAVYREAVKRGALLRPLGNTLYWCPPLTITENELEQLADITKTALHISTRGGAG